MPIIDIEVNMSQNNAFCLIILKHLSLKTNVVSVQQRKISVKTWGTSKEVLKIIIVISQANKSS